MDLIAAMIIAAAVAWWMRSEERDLQRRLTAPERARRASRCLEIDMVTAYAERGDELFEHYLWATLIADLCALRDRRQADEYLHEHYGLEPREEGMGVAPEYGPPPWYLVALVIGAVVVIALIAVWPP